MMRVLFTTAALSLMLASGSHAQEAARYRLELKATWSAETHPQEFPAGAHFSGLIGASHDSRYVLFADGQTASSGLELLAENGRVSLLQAELAEAVRRGRVGAVFTGQGLSTLPGQTTAEFDIDANHPFVSVVTMIAPSPDWFTGVSSVSLAREGTWIDRLEVVLWAWDAGTDGGTTYAAADRDTQPRESVRLLATPHFLGRDGLKSVGTVTFVRLR
jgi:Spondin_N